MDARTRTQQALRIWETGKTKDMASVVEPRIGKTTEDKVAKDHIQRCGALRQGKRNTSHRSASVVETLMGKFEKEHAALQERVEGYGDLV